MNQTSGNLKLKKPLNGELVNTWDEACNPNWDDIDTGVTSVQNEIVGARGVAEDLGTRLAPVFNDDGTVASSPEVVAARSSFSNGDQNPDTGDFYDLNTRLNVSDRELFNVREGRAALRDSLAARFLNKNQVLSGLADGNNYPTWLGYSGLTASINGTSQALWLMINGYVCRIRTTKTVTVPSTTATYYLYAQFHAAGVVNVDASGGTNGVISDDGVEVRKFTDLTIDFSARDVAIGDVLSVLGSGVNARDYQLRVINPSADVNALQIYGFFTAAGAALPYKISDPIAVTVGYDTVKGVDATKFYFAEVDVSAGAISAKRMVAFQSQFIGEWRAIDVSSISTFSQVYNHNLFDDTIEVAVQVSQANDGSAAVEELSVAQGTSMTRSIKLKWTPYAITIANAVASVFYTDYGGSVRQTGYVRVVARKRKV